MKKFTHSTRRFLCALLGGALLALPGGGAFAADAANTWHTRRITTGAAGLRIENLWSRGAALRSEVVVNGHPVITLVEGPRYVVVDLLRGVGIAVQRHANARAQDSPKLRPFGSELEIMNTQGGEFVGMDVFAGVDCRLHRLTNSRGRQEVCVLGDEGKKELPVFVRHWDRDTNRDTNIQYVNWRQGFEIADNFFAPDPRLQLTSFEYDAYVKALGEGRADMPILYPLLLHGPREP